MLAVEREIGKTRSKPQTKLPVEVDAQKLDRTLRRRAVVPDLEQLDEHVNESLRARRRHQTGAGQLSESRGEKPPALSCATNTALN